MQPTFITDGHGRKYHTHFDKRVFVKAAGTLSQFSFELTDLISDNSRPNWDALEFSRYFGFIYPPATSYTGIYLIPPATFFEIHDSEIFIGNLVNEIVAIKHTSETENDLSLYIERQLEESIEKIVSAANKANVQCLFSAGIDSSALLGILKRNFRAKALMCDMPSMPSEKKKAISMSREGKFDIEIISLDSNLKAYIDKSIALIKEPIFDNAAILLLALLSEAKADPKEQLIFDGQGADSLFFGLPHNRVFTLHKKFGPLFQSFSFLNFFSKINKRDTRFRRSIYRISRALDLLFSSSQTNFLIKSLMLPGREQSDIDGNSTFCQMKNDVDKLVIRFSEDPQSAIRALFMLRLLPARELQKYDVLRKAGYKVVLPYMQEALVIEMFSKSSENFIVNGTYKFPVYNLCKKLWPGFFESFSTSPFYHHFSSAGETDILKYTTNVVHSNIES